MRVAAIACILLALPACAEAPSWAGDLPERIAKLDRESPGELGVYVKPLNGEAAFEHQASREWYLSSTVKVPIAIVLLRQVQDGKLSLDEELTLQASDFVDGSGEVQGRAPGTRMTLRYLLEKMLTQSDSTATDMLIRRAGLDEINAFLRREGMGRITTLLQVRHDAYGELHPKAASLSNLDFMEIKKAGAPAARRTALARKLGVPESELKASTLEEAFERYYARGLNSASLTSFGRLLERLAEGELLSKENTALVLGHMKAMTTGERRIKAGLPPGTPFAQKTGTQVQRICNVGIVRPAEPDGLVVAACVENFGDQAAAEQLLARVGQAVSGAF